MLAFYIHPYKSSYRHDLQEHNDTHNIFKQQHMQAIFDPKVCLLPPKSPTPTDFPHLPSAPRLHHNGHSQLGGPPNKVRSGLLPISLSIVAFFNLQVWQVNLADHVKHHAHTHEKYRCSAKASHHRIIALHIHRQINNKAYAAKCQEITEKCRIKRKILCLTGLFHAPPQV